MEENKKILLQLFFFYVSGMIIISVAIFGFIIFITIVIVNGHNNPSSIPGQIIQSCNFFHHVFPKTNPMATSQVNLVSEDSSINQNLSNNFTIESSFWCNDICLKTYIQIGLYVSGLSFGKINCDSSIYTYFDFWKCKNKEIHSTHFLEILKVVHNTFESVEINKHDHLLISIIIILIFVWMELEYFDLAFVF